MMGTNDKLCEAVLATRKHLKNLEQLDGLEEALVAAQAHRVYMKLIWARPNSDYSNELHIDGRLLEEILEAVKAYVARCKEELL